MLPHQKVSKTKLLSEVKNRLTSIEDGETRLLVGIEFDIAEAEGSAWYLLGVVEVFARQVIF